jgi:uncharacterized protein with PIN domain
MTFVCDVMLGKLAKYLRILGLDAPHLKNATDLNKYKGQDKSSLFLTRRTSLRDEEGTLFIRSDRTKGQVMEISDAIRPYFDPTKVMTRCIRCNLTLADIERADIEQYVPEFVFHKYKTFKTCPQCRKVYWEGSHAENMTRFLKEVFGEGGME